MTTLIEDVQAVLAPLASGGSWYAVNTAEPPTYPYITFMRIVSVSNYTFAGPTDLQNTRVQVDVVSRSISEAQAIETAVEAAMAAASAFASVQISQQDIYEPDVKAYRCSADFSVWSTH